MRGRPLPFTVVDGLNITHISGRGRLEQSHDYELVTSTYGEDAVRIVQAQEQEDLMNDDFTPNTGSNEMRQNTPLGEFVLEGLIAQSGESTTFSLVGNPDVMIEYHADCFDVWRRPGDEDTVVHPLIFAYWYGREAASHNMSMEPIFLSPAAPLCPNKNGTCNFENMSEENFAHCRRRGGSMRYMLIQKSQYHTLREAAIRYGGKVPFGTTMDFGKGMMLRLKKLHKEARIVHGDINSNNVILERNTRNKYSIKLMDFGKASRVLSSWPDDVRVEFPDKSHYRFTQWMLDGHYLAPRDDVMKTIQMLAQLMHGRDAYTRIERHHQRAGYDAQRLFKMEHDLFSPMVPGSIGRRLDEVESLAVSEDNKTLIRLELANILRIVRELKTTNSVIPYDILSASFRRCASLSSTITGTTN